MLTYFFCPDSTKILIKECLDKCPRKEGRCLALSHLYAISEQRIWEGKASVTQLIKGTREAYLQIVSDYAVEPDAMAFMLYGTLHHKRLETINKRLDGLAEYTMTQEISGTIDRLEPDELNEGSYKLIDYKLVGAYSITADKTEWELQLNRYRLLIENDPKLKGLFPISRMLIQATLRDSGLRQMEALNLPKRMPLIPIKKMDDEDVFYYFHDKETALQTALAKKELPPMCSYEERWSNRKCLKYCLVKEFCPEGNKMR